MSTECDIEPAQQDYAAFIASKFVAPPPCGFDWPAGRLPAGMHEWQRKVVLWTLRRGRAALFLDTGLGKTLQQLAFAAAVVQHTGRPVLLLTPLAVGPQTIREATKFGVTVPVRSAESQADISGPGVWVTNYQKLHKFDRETFGGIVLDESSIVKSYAGKVRNQLLDFMRDIPYRLMCTATPAPNDHEELGNHAELLGVCSRTEMLATFFVHDSGDTSEWRLKGHAVKEFWEWVATWAMVARRPSDLGYPDAGYDLPPFEMVEHVVAAEGVTKGTLFTVSETTLAGQRIARRASLAARVAKVAELVATEPDEPWLVWAELNDEADALEAAITGAIQVAGSDSDAVKSARLEAFSKGDALTLVSKASLCGYGMNWQHCARIAFVGLSHSFEQFYQAIRRCWRYGQTRRVVVHVVTGEAETAVLDNVREKAANHAAMFDGIVKYTGAINMAAIGGHAPRHDAYTTGMECGDGWTAYLGDCVEGVRRLESESVGYSVFSPPFSSLYTYSNSPRDMGNCRSDGEFLNHFRFLCGELYRAIMPGRLLSFHVMNLPTTKERDGYIGIRDFRGALIKEFEAAGFIFHSEVCIWKDPVTVMQRTKAIGLLHKQIKKDSCRSRQGIPDYLVTMLKPGDNPEPVAGRFDSFVGIGGPPVVRMDGVYVEDSDRLEKDRERFSIEVWQRYASPVWMDIDQGRTLNNYRDGREDDDERHICPLQLDVIERCLDLWSNPGDLVLSPFMGIGSEGYCSVKAGRKFVGFELKPSYHAVAVKNLRAAEKAAKQVDLFATVTQEEAAECS